MKPRTWRGIWTILAAGVFVLALVPDADAQRGRGGARAGGGGGGFSRGGPASGGGFAAGGGQRGGGAQAGQRADRGTSTANQGQRQDARGERQSSRQDAAGQRQSNRQDSYSSNNDDCDNCWDGAAVAAGVVAGAVAVGAATASQPAPTTYTNQAQQQVPPPCNVAPVAVDGVPYYKCGATWYTAGYGNAGVVYMPVPPPRGN